MTSGAPLSPNLQDIYQINGDNGSWSHTWLRRHDTKHLTWFTVLKDVKFKVQPAPAPGGQISTGIGTQGCHREKLYNIVIRMRKLLKFSDDTQSTFNAGTISQANTQSPFSFRLIMILAADYAMSYMYNARQYYTEIPM